MGVATFNQFYHFLLYHGFCVCNIKTLNWKATRHCIKNLFIIVCCSNAPSTPAICFITSNKIKDNWNIYNLDQLLTTWQCWSCLGRTQGDYLVIVNLFTPMCDVMRGDHRMCGHGQLCGRELTWRFIFCWFPIQINQKMCILWLLIGWMHAIILYTLYFPLNYFYCKANSILISNVWLLCMTFNI